MSHTLVYVLVELCLSLFLLFQGLKTSLVLTAKIVRTSDLLKICGLLQAIEHEEVEYELKKGSSDCPCIGH